jgi:glutathione S-transferase
MRASRDDKRQEGDMKPYYAPGTIIVDAACHLARKRSLLCRRRGPRSLEKAHAAVERAQLQAWLNFLFSELPKRGLGPLFYPALDERAKDVFRERLKARFAGRTG